MRTFNWANSDGGFKDLVGLDSEKSWIEQCNKCLSDLKKLKDAEKGKDGSIIDGCIDTAKVISVVADIAKEAPVADIAKEAPEAEVLSRVGKRKATDKLIEQLTVPSKRKPKQEVAQKSNFQQKVDNCCIGMFHIYV